MEEYCDLVDKSTYDATIQEIMSIFNLIKSGKAPDDLMLLNYYKGVPISYKTSLVDMDQDTVTLTLHPNQGVVMGKTLKTFIASCNFRKHILADVFILTPRQQEVSLRNFIFTEVLSTRRNYIRIDMDEPTDIKLTIDNKVVIGKLLDISLVSVAVALPDNIEIEHGTTVGLKMRLPAPGGITFVDMSAEAVFFKKIDTLHCSKHIFLLKESKLNEPILSQYMVQRQMEIMKEIKELHWAV